MGGTLLYLDHNASSPLHPLARAAMQKAMEHAGNPSSVHSAGRAARAILEESRACIATSVGASAENVIFTSGGSEANNFMLANAGDRPILISAIEHESILRPARALSARLIPVTAQGQVDVAALEAVLKEIEKPALVSIMAANNETGIVQPIAACADCVHNFGGLLHVDASQAWNKIPIRFAQWGADFLTLSAHKAGGPLGVGALILAQNRPLIPLIRGGGQERTHRAGTENVPAIAGFAALAGLMSFAPLDSWRDILEKTLLEEDPSVHIIGASVSRLPNTSCLTKTGMAASKIVIALDLAGVAISAGSASSSGKTQPSHVLPAMGYDAATAQSAVRLSLGPDFSAASLDLFLTAWRQFRNPSNARGESKHLLRQDQKEQALC